MPSPWTSIGAFANAACTNLGSTMPQSPRWRGPTVLKNRTTTEGSSCSSAKAKCSSTALLCAYDQRATVVGPYTESSVS
nr:hypothetical protein [uncultured bacterium]